MTTKTISFWAGLTTVALIVLASLSHPEIAVEVAVIAACVALIVALLHGRRNE